MYRLLLAKAPSSKNSRVMILSNAPTLLFNTLMNRFDERLHKSRKVYVDYRIKWYLH